jgi:hypothetical protein
LRTRTPGAGRDDRGHGRDIERPGAVAAGAAVVKGLTGRTRQRRGPLAHRAGEAQHLGRPLALERERHEQSRDLRGLCLAIHDGAHHARGLRAREVLVPAQLLENLRKHHVVSRKFLSN